MNKKTVFMTLSLLLGAAFVGSCGNDKDEQQPKVELHTEGAITGWTKATHIPPEGGRQFFVDFYSPGETATVNVSKDDAGRLTLSYSSTAWGNAEFKALEVKADKDGGYELPAGVKTTIVMEHGAMGQQGGGGEYELTLVKGNVDQELKNISLIMSAFMNPNHGSYELTFHEGDAPAPVVQ